MLIEGERGRGSVREKGWGGYSMHQMYGMC